MYDPGKGWMTHEIFWGEASWEPVTALRVFGEELFNSFQENISTLCSAFSCSWR